MTNWNNVIFYEAGKHLPALGIILQLCRHSAFYCDLALLSPLTLNFICCAIQNCIGDTYACISSDTYSLGPGDPWHVSVDIVEPPRPAVLTFLNDTLLRADNSDLKTRNRAKPVRYRFLPVLHVFRTLRIPCVALSKLSILRLLLLLERLRSASILNEFKLN